MSIIHPKKYYAIPKAQRPDLEVGVNSISVADGGKIRPVGKVTLPLEIPDVGILNQELLVAETSEPLVLGYDFFQKHQCVIDLVNNTIDIGGKTVPCCLESKLASLFRIRVDENITIPANSEMIIPAYVQHSDDEVLPSEMMLEGCPKAIEKKGVFIARSLVSLGSHRIPVRVLNPSDEAKSLYKEMVLGLGSQIAKSESVNLKARSIEPEISNTDILPDHVQTLWNQCKNELSLTEQTQAESLLIEYSDVFARSKADLGKTSLFQHRINTGNSAPIKQRPRRVPMSKRQVERDEIEKMLENDIITPSNSPWSSPIVLVTKKDGSCRFCIDYRKLNDVTIKDSYSLPNPNDCLQSLNGSKWFSTLDLASGYWQMEMHPDDKSKTAFTTQSGLYEFNVMPFGLTNAPSSFERLMEKVLSGLQYDICLLYLDDIIVKSNTFENQILYLKQVFERLRQANLKLSPKKCHLFKHKVAFLGHIVSDEGISTNPEKVETVKSWPIPKNIKQVRGFLGLCSYYRKSIRNFSTIAKPLTRLTEKQMTRFSWTSECMEAFNELKSCLVSAPILTYPDIEQDFILDTDASGVGIGAILSQKQDGQERVIAYYSKVLSKSERNYCVTRRELLAIVEAIKHFHTYLYGVTFTIRTDHGSLRWLLNFKNLEGQLCRWAELLGTYNYTIEHRAGKLHGNADALSRRPCQFCKYCDRVESKEVTWSAQTAECDCTSLTPERGTNHNLNPEETGNVQNCEAFQAIKHGNMNIRSISDGSNTDSDTLVGNDDSSTELDEGWLKPISDKDYLEALSQDDDLKRFVEWKTQGSRPSWQDITKYSTTLKSYWAQWDRLELRGVLLYRRWVDSRINESWQLVIPSPMRKELFSQILNQKWSGHLGVKRTMGRMRRRGYWVGYKADITTWCQSCPQCQKRKSPNKKAHHPMRQYLVGAPMERVAVDILGPLPESNLGNKYICIVSDYFTKWVEAFPMPNQEAETIAKELVDKFFSRFGIPLSIHSDQGAQFESMLFQQLCELLNLDKTRTTPYRPQSDGLVERFNRTLEDMLSKFVAADQRDWDSNLPLLMLAYRSSIHDSTGQSPYLMMFGRETILPVDLLLGPNTVKTEENVTCVSYIQGLRQNMAKIHELARDKLLEASDNQKRHYDIRSNTHSYRQGDKVYLFDPSKKKGISPKLQCRWTGPFEIIEQLSDLLYKVKLTNRVKVIHHDRLKPCYGSGQIQEEGNNRVSCTREKQESDQVVSREEEETVTRNVSLGIPSVVTRTGRNINLPKKYSDFQMH